MSFDLDGFLPYRLSVAAARISRRFAGLYGPEAGLTIPEWRVLAHLSQSGPVRVRDINARVNLDKSVVSRAASRLEQAGLLRKSSEDSDQRLVALDLTDQGRELMERMGRIAETFQADLMRELGEDGPQLSRTLGRLMNRA